MRESVIVSAARLPTGKFLGSLSSLQATDLGSRVIREAVTRAGIETTVVDECIMGNVVSAGLGQAPARQAAQQPSCRPAVAGGTQRSAAEDLPQHPQSGRHTPAHGRRTRAHSVLERDST